MNEALYPILLIDDERRGGRCSTSNWDTDFRGAERPVTNDDIVRFRRLLRTTKQYPTTVKRDINPQQSGTLTFETVIRLVSGDGFFLGFYHEDAEVIRLDFVGGKVNAADVTLCELAAGEHTLYMKLDIDAGVTELLFDGHIRATAYFTGSARVISSFRAGFDGDALGEAGIFCNVKLTKGYLVYDSCLPGLAMPLPDFYSFEATGDAEASYEEYNNARAEYVYAIKNRSSSISSVSRRFARSAGKTVAEIKYRLPSCANASVALLCGGGEAIRLFDGGNALTTADGAVLREHHQNVWQTLRITADTDAHTALVRLNGKVVTVLPLSDAQFIDGIAVTLSSDGEAVLQFADLFVFHQSPEPADYVPEPVVPKKKVADRYVGMNICSLWRGGHHYGWDCITPFDTNKPLLGWFDEGIPETADWELKWMCEHGIDFELYCWYASETDRPMIRTPWSSAIHGGHMLAKYSDKVKMALLWEASSGAHPTRESFREYFVPYWIDHFFTDDRYMSIDNKAIMSVYAPEQLVRDFGSPAALHEELDYLREKVKEVGYDDLIILCTSENRALLAECGFDGINAYSWGAFGYDPEYTRKCILDNTAAGFVHTVPTVSVGYNVVAWSGVRHPNMKPCDMADTLQWCVDEILPRYDKDSWQSKLVMLSTWNEFGEGTYICPAALHRFGYLDAVRKVFCDDLPHTDAAPNERQQSRICMTYPHDRGTLSPLHLLPKDTNDYGVYKRYTFATKEDLDKWEFHGLTHLEIRDGVLYGHSDGFNPYMILKDTSLFPFAAHKIAAVRAHTRVYKPVEQMCCIQGFFSRSDDGKYEPMGLYCASVPDRIAALTMPTDVPKLGWQDNITAFRFDPVYAEGDFELVDIEFVLAAPNKRLLVNGREISMSVPVMSEGGVDYVPFDTKSTFPESMPMYFEWHNAAKCFELRGVNTSMFRLHESVYTVDGVEKTLPKPFFLTDGIPMIPSDVLADVLGLTLTVSDDALSFERR